MRFMLIKLPKTILNSNLKGRIKKLTEINLITKDTLESSYNIFGQLIYECKSSPYSKYTKEYFFNGNQLVKIRLNEFANNRISEWFYDNQGLLEKRTDQWENSTAKTFFRTGTYHYNSEITEITVSYDYKQKMNGWDIVQSETYKLTYQNKKPVKIRSISKHGETEYGATTTIGYDSTTTKPHFIALNDDCAGSNSCLILHLKITYDKNGNIISENMIDRTIRNALWSYGYSFKAKYNSHNDIVEEYRKNSNEMEGNSLIAFTLKDTTNNYPDDYDHLKQTYHYSYDTGNNWIKKYVLKATNSELIVKREIEYY